jgi:hypothetical protein
MTASRSGHTATLLSDGKVLIAGGRASFGGGAWGETAQSSAVRSAGGYVYSYWLDERGARRPHATLLNNGKVLIGGGVTFAGGKQTFLGTAELYDPAAGAFTPAGNMQAARTALTATLLASGKVLMSSYFNYTSAKQ